ncbi:Ssy1p KNAG_0A05040 [Huiozyma naganishii CBS 8797]|uniref:Amino acid permease/ SLC12A domain-containing protein n=1 Tax=Huiozyma naganishii (strain ATCC MYA-139 / BCRC 22969 / CBS 8797 / KCTC 17520 / NBRC 10181 / NCYC 3082 / Yp74L-3) TaxID=1071383 RepID=J7RTT1_HUIN7|nr:hypothetical protein KNAG_0A05040 [Kazachstania naganishii CBS 8797]CCK68172.1 hypothetical protein KNAG_0A05040 [Kazachstania naganishii CBS 8797]
MDLQDHSKDLFPSRATILSGSILLDDDTDEKKSSDLQTTKSSIDTGLITGIINQEKWHNVDEYHDEVRNERFYLSNRYPSRKQSITIEDMLTKDNKTDSYLPTSDFMDYNRKVQREFDLREKIETALKRKDPGTIAIHNDESLENLYIAGNGSKSATKSLPDTSCFLNKHTPNNNSEESQSRSNDSTLSTFSTHIIDHTSYRNLAIDETNPFEQVPYQLRKPTTTAFDYPNVSASGDSYLKRAIRNYFVTRQNGVPYHIQRRLTVRHIQMLSVGPCLSVGLFLTSGRAFSIAGPFGTLLGFCLSGCVILATLLSFTELSTLIPVSSGFSGLASRFVEDAFGFAIGWTYTFSCIIAFPAEAASSTFFLTYYSHPLLNKSVISGFVTLFLSFPIVSNLLQVNYLGEVVFFFGAVKLIVSILIILVMIILNAGHGHRDHHRVGFRFWDSSKSFDNLTYGLFRPTYDLRDEGTGSRNGIGGSTGRFLSVVSVMLISTFAYSGVEMTFLASGEAVNPRKTIPSSIKRTFSSILLIYVLAILTVGINIYSGDPRLLAYLSKPTSNRSEAARNGVGTQWQLDVSCNPRSHISGPLENGYSSPWVLALQSFGMCAFASAFNGLLIVFTATSAISSLYNSSRTLYAMSIQRKAPYIFQLCNRYGVPYVAVLVASSFGVIAYIAVNEQSQNNFSILTNMSSASTSIIWFGMNLSFLRFYYALNRRTDSLSRDDEAYPFRSPFQPYLAFFGLFGCFIFVLFMGYPNFLTHFWSARGFFSAYGGLLICGVCYLGYKIFCTSKIQRLDQLDMDTGRRELDRMKWVENQQYSGGVINRFKQFLRHSFR